MAQKVEMWQASDGRLFHDEATANVYEDFLKAREMYELEKLEEISWEDFVNWLQDHMQQVSSTILALRHLKNAGIKPFEG